MGFFRDGGILGALRGYDSEKNGGSPYGFDELSEDIQKLPGIARDFDKAARKGMRDGRRILTRLGMD